jgi:hypothetical protein
MNIVDKEKMNLSSCDTLFISVNVNKQTPLVPSKALVRYKFMEIVMKMGIKRYFETGDSKTELDAVDMFNHRNLNPFFELTETS